MKRLMIAASVVAVGAAALADVYNVKFTTTTLVDAVKKNVKQDDGTKADVEYYKKGTVTINGLYDDGNGSYLPVYYFWTGTGKKLSPVKDVVFEMTNYVDMDSQVKGKNIGLNVGLYVGSKDDLTGYFVSGGIGKLESVAGKIKSASGSFGGQWTGLPAYGSWSISKAKKSMTEELTKALKSSEYKAEDLEGKRDATSIAQQAAEIKALIDEMAGKDHQIGLLKEELFLAEQKIKELEESGDDPEALKKWQEYADSLKTELVKAKDIVDNLFEQLDGSFLADTLAGMTNTLANSYDYATNELAKVEAAIAAYAETGATVKTNAAGNVASYNDVTLSADWTNSLWTAWADAQKAADAALADAEAVENQIDDEYDTLEYMEATRWSYADFFDEWSDKTNNLRRAIEGYEADDGEGTYHVNGYKDDIADAYEFWTNTIDSIKGNYDTVVENLQILTNDLAGALADVVEDYDDAVAAYDDYTTNNIPGEASVARYSDDDAGYKNWLYDTPEYGYDPDTMPEYHQWLVNEGYTDAKLRQEYGYKRNNVLKKQEELMEEVRAAELEVEKAQTQLDKVVGILNEVVAAGKDDPSKWVGKAKELKEQADKDLAETVAEYTELIEKAEAKIALLQSQIDSKKTTTPYTDAQIEAQGAKISYLETNDYVNAEAARDAAIIAAEEAFALANKPKTATNGWRDRVTAVKELIFDEYGNAYRPWDPGYAEACDYTIATLTKAKEDAEAGIATAKALMEVGGKPEIVIPDFPSDPDTPAEETPAEETPAEETPAEETPAEQA